MREAPLDLGLAGLVETAMAELESVTVVVARARFDRISDVLPQRHALRIPREDGFHRVVQDVLYELGCVVVIDLAHVRDEPSADAGIPLHRFEEAGLHDLTVERPDPLDRGNAGRLAVRASLLLLHHLGRA